MRGFIARFILGILAAWVGSALLPGITTDGKATTFMLLALFLALGEIVLQTIEGGARVFLFFLPKSVRIFILRAAVVAIAASLVNGFSFADRQIVGLVGLTIVLSLLYMLPFTS